jgi:alpha-D-xyloside xylohydrolase
MIDILHRHGWHVMTWGGPWALGYKKGEFGYEARKNHYLIGNRNIDYTNPAAFDWQKEKIVEFMKSSGIDAWKLDRGDEYNPSQKHDIYYNGVSGFQLHNEYPYLYIKAYYEASKSVRGDDFLIMARAADNHTTTMAINYAGDTPGAVRVHGRMQGTDLGLRSVIIELQRVAFMGFPNWGSDTGGYEPFRSREVFARWIALSCFCPLMEIGGVGSHEPWAMDTEPKYDEELIRIFHRFSWIHQRLADYSYAFAQRAHETGDPIVHPLVFDWPDDPKVADMWDEYLYGPSLLVAPIWKQGQKGREVYLPKGKWIDLWDQSKMYEGPTMIRISVPLDKMAVFIRAERAEMLPKGLVDGL